MRKKSHISLARYLVKYSEHEQLKKHKLAFYIGSILPDIKPSFLYRKHEITGTFEDLIQVITELKEENRGGGNRSRYYRDLGQVTHYLADYFTYPHNHCYPGNLKDHCSYEEKLKRDLRKYLKNATEGFGDIQRIDFSDVDQIETFIRQRHQMYLEIAQEIHTDILNILHVNFHTVDAILSS